MMEIRLNNVSPVVKVIKVQIVQTTKINKIRIICHLLSLISYLFLSTFQQSESVINLAAEKYILQLFCTF
jgi:hypothetical protein